MCVYPDILLSIHAKYAHRANAARKIRAPRIKACMRSLPSVCFVVETHPCASVFICGSKGIF